MAESTSPKGNSGAFAKKVQRQLSRGKEKVQTLGFIVSQIPKTRKEKRDLDVSLLYCR